MLIANGLALIVESGLKGFSASPSGSQGAIGPTPVSVLLDFVLGAFLLAGRAKVLPWVKLRVILGGIVFTALLFAKANLGLAVLQMTFSAGLALLLFGNAARARIAAGLVAAGLVLGLETIGLVGMATGTAPLARIVMAPSLEGGAADVVEGVVFPYRVTASGGPWYVRKAAAAKKDNPLADRWLVWPLRDAHVLVIAERLEQQMVVDMDRFVDVVVGNARKGAADLQLVDRQALPRGGTLVHTRGTVNGLRVESFYGLYAQDDWIFQVIAFSGERQFAAVREDLGAIVASFETPQR